MDCFIRQILTYKDGLRAERVELSDVMGMNLGSTVFWWVSVLMKPNVLDRH